MPSPIRINQEELAKLPPEEQAEFAAMLAELEELLEENPLAAYIPHAKQREFHSAKTKIKAFFGGNRSGKTTGSVVDDLIQAIDEDWVPDHLKAYKKWEPPFYGRIVTPDFTRTLGYVSEAIRKHVPPSQLLGGNWEKAYDKQNRVVRFANESRIDFMTAEQDIDKFGGAALHRVHFDEEPPGEKGQQIYQECFARTIDYDGDLVFSMTPLMGLSWVFEEVWERRHQENISVVQVDMDDNPHLNQRAKEEFLATLSDVERQARKQGLFVHFKGTFYPEFTDRFHVVDPPTKEAIQSQDVLCIIDPGLNRPGVLWMAFDNENAALAFDEMIPKGLTPEEQAPLIKAKHEKWGIKDVRYVIDPAARNRATVNADNVEAAYARAGIYCEHGQNDRASGILEVKRRLQHRGLFVSRDCETLIWEIGRYRKDPNSANEFDAVKVNDDLVDCLRYGVMARTWSVPSPVKKPREYDPFREEPPFRPQPQPVGPLGAWS